MLRRAGIVDSRRVKSTVLCSLRDPQTAELLGVARRMLTQNLRQAQALLTALDIDRTMGVCDAHGRATWALA